MSSKALLVRELEESKYEVVAGATSPQSGETSGTRKTSRSRDEVDRRRGHRSAVRRIICSWQEFCLLIRSAARRLYANDVPSSQFAYPGWIVATQRLRFHLW